MANDSPYFDSFSWDAPFSFEHDAITRALRISLSDPAASPSPEPASPDRTAARPARPAPPPTGRVGKRRPRAARKSATTYINADPENFREMVQRVTGIRVEPGSGAGPAVKPQPNRFLGKKGAAAAAQRQQQQQSCLLPTLDTSAFWLDRLRRAEPGGAAAGSVGPDPVFEFEPLPSFPTLESWGVM